MVLSRRGPHCSIRVNAAWGCQLSHAPMPAKQLHLDNTSVLGPMHLSRFPAARQAASIQCSAAGSLPPSFFALLGLETASDVHGLMSTRRLAEGFVHCA